MNPAIIYSIINGDHPDIPSLSSVMTSFSTLMVRKCKLHTSVGRVALLETPTDLQVLF